MFRILVAEDDESTRLLMCEVLHQAGYEPCPARDGVDAVDRSGGKTGGLSISGMYPPGFLQGAVERPQVDGSDF